MSLRQDMLQAVHRKTMMIVYGNYAQMDMLVYNSKCPGCAASWDINEAKMHKIPFNKDSLAIASIPCTQDWIDAGVVAS